MGSRLAMAAVVLVVGLGISSPARAVDTGGMVSPQVLAETLAARIVSALPVGQREVTMIAGHAVPAGMSWREYRRMVVRAQHVAHR